MTEREEIMRGVVALASRIVAECMPSEVVVVWPKGTQHRVLSRVPTQCFVPFEAAGRSLRLAFVPATRAAEFFESAVARERYAALRRSRARLIVLVLGTGPAIVRVGRDGGVLEPEAMTS